MNKKDVYRINLESIIPASSILLTGRDNGITARDKLRLEILEREYEKIEIVIPEKIISFNSSFFLGLFTASMKMLGGKEKFIEKYIFVCNEDIQEDINDGIEEALKESQILR